MIVLSGRRSAVSTCAFTKDGKFIAGAMLDGSIQLWKSAGPYVSHRNINFKGTCGIVLFFLPPSFLFFQMRSSMQHYGAHQQGSETSCLCFAHDNQTLISRGGEIIKFRYFR